MLIGTVARYTVAHNTSCWVKIIEKCQNTPIRSVSDGEVHIRSSSRSTIIKLNVIDFAKGITVKKISSIINFLTSQGGVCSCTTPSSILPL